MDDLMSILIPAHDSYSDVLQLFINQLHENWTNCKYHIFWSNEKLVLEGEDIVVLNNGENSTFCKRIKNALEIIETEYILLMLEDFIIIDRINQIYLDELLQYMDKNSILYCNLSSLKNGKYMSTTEVANIYNIKNNMPYGISINVGIFRKDFLKELLENENWNGWELENYLLGMSKKKMIKACIYDDSNPLHVVHLIEKGKIIPTAKNTLEKKGIDLLNINRAELSKKYLAKKKIITFFGRICPTNARKYVKKIGNIFGFKFVTKN